MGADRLIGGAPQPGGITFEEIEDLRIDLGLGNNKFTIDQTHTGKTTVNTNRGNDEVYVKTISRPHLRQPRRRQRHADDHERRAEARPAARAADRER